MSSKVLDCHTPLDVFRNYFPLTSVYADLPLKVFGCTAFVHAHKQLDKLEPRAIKCVFTGYSPTHKGYRCFEPKSKRTFVTTNVTFVENQPFFSDIHLQGENFKEDSSFTFENIITLSDIVLSQNFETYIDVPKENAQECILELNPIINEVSTDSVAIISNQNHNDQILDLNNNEGPPEMPQHNDSDKETQSRLTTIGPTWEGNVFERRNHKQRNEGPILRPFQDSEPIDNPTHHLDTGNSSSVLKSHVEYPDIDLPIAIRKPVRSCTKYHLSNYVSYSKLSSSFAAFTSKLSAVEIPKKYTGGSKNSKVEGSYS
uniref:Uncharacterized protein LOC113787228 n=1 Tax=Cicer arietinum TaxID=3827 RepID=A0A3Q7XUP5_CICAR|nr:uncharacterized protein LOC113787228 [Cicer arietinum]